MHTMEVVAAGTGLNFCVAIDNLLQELGIKQGRLTPYYLDSLSSVNVGKRDKAVKLSAWLQRRTLVLHEASDTEVLIIHIPGTDMLADPFTKYLKYETWRRHMSPSAREVRRLPSAEPTDPAPSPSAHDSALSRRLSEAETQVHIFRGAFASFQSEEKALDSLEALALRWMALSKDVPLHSLHSQRRATAGGDSLARRVRRALQELRVHGFAPNATPCTRLLYFSDGRMQLNKSSRKFLCANADIALRLATSTPPPLAGRAWTEAEDAQLAEGHPTPGRSYRAITYRRHILQCSSKTVAYSKAVYNSLGSPQALQYESWLPIHRAQHLPANAEVSWKQGVARIPKAWQLSLPAASFALPKGSKQLPLNAELVLMNVTAETKVASIIEEAHAFLQSHFPFFGQGQLLQ